MKCLCYRRDCEPLTERHVQAVWYDRVLRPGNLVSRRGEEVRVIYPGDWNVEAGPDFRNAVLEVGRDRRRLRGDVEIHLSPGDWDVHHHGDDPAYRQVICHVTWRCGPIPDSLPAGAISIWLGRFMTADIGFSPDQIDLEAYPYARLPAGKRPCGERLMNDPELAAEVLYAAGDYRLRSKARRITRLLTRKTECQLFYEEVMNALGYKRNSRGFRIVAERVPYAQLMAEREHAARAFLVAAEFAEWNLSSVRPRNRPEARLKAAAELFASTEVMALMAARDFSPIGCREMLELMMAGGWIGRGRAAAILANVVVPWAIAKGRISHAPEWLPGEDISVPVRQTAFRMFGRDHRPGAWYANNGVRIQGLIQIHRDYCLRVHPDCFGCGMMEDLGRAG